jgi:hypothetical protein
MLPDNGSELSPHLTHLSEYAAASIKHIMKFAEHMKTVTDTLPDDLKPTGQALAEISIQALAESYIESLMLISELGLQQITRSARPANHHTEPD